MKVPSFDQKLQVYEALKECIVKLDDRYVEIKDGYSEQGIANRIGVSLWIVQEMRRTKFGIFRDKIGGSSHQGQGKMLDTVIDLDRQQQFTDIAVAQLTRRLDMLIFALKEKGVIDAHLE